jgi:hypothetical protein
VLGAGMVTILLSNPPQSSKINQLTFVRATKIGEWEREEEGMRAGMV